MLDAAGGDGLADALVHGGADGFVEIFLVGMQLNEMDHLGFRRQLLRHLILGATQDQRGDPLFQQRVFFRIALFLDGFAEVFLKRILGA